MQAPQKWFSFRHLLHWERWTFPHWPPLASHFCCFLLGVLMMTLQRAPPPEAFKSGSFYVLTSQLESYPLQRYLKVLRTDPSHESCVFMNPEVEVRSFGEQRLLEVPLKAPLPTAFLHFLETLQKGSFQLVTTQNERAPYCENLPRIHYGQSSYRH